MMIHVIITKLADSVLLNLVIVDNTAAPALCIVFLLVV